MNADKKKETDKKSATQEVKDRIHQFGTSKGRLDKFLDNPFVKKK